MQFAATVERTSQRFSYFECVKTETQNQKSFFSLQTRSLAEFFKGLNSSPVQSSAETFLHKNMCKLLAF